jgi:DNA-binding response OmpR family regulator
MHTLLVVEDAAEVRRPLAKLLRQEGYNVLTAIDAYSAAQAIRTNHPDLILLDVGIPPMDGLTMLTLLHQESPDYNIPVILVTAHGDEHTVTRGRQLGVKAHLLKSQYTVGQLLDLIKQHVARAQPAS